MRGEFVLRVFTIAVAASLITGLSPSNTITIFAADAAARFPQLTSENISGKTMRLPGDFEGDRNLLFIAFQREQQKNVDTWLHEIRRFTELDPKLHYYELPTISRLNGLARWFINGGMRRGIPDQGQRDRTITLYLDKKPFLESLHITDESRVYAIVVDRQGNVLWRAEGDFAEDKARSLRDFLQHK